MKNINLFILVAVASLLLPSVSLVAAQDTTEVRISWWGGQNRHDRTIAVIELYEELNPGIDIVYEFQGFPDHWTKLSTQAAGGELPDIIQQNYPRLREWYDNDLLLPLDGYVADGVIDTEFISENTLSSGVVNGELVAIPLGTNSAAIALDVDMFAEAGIELPPVDWTWEEFEQIALQLHESLDVYGVGALITLEEFWKVIYMACCDQWAFNADGTALGYDDDQYLIEYYEMLVRLQEAGAMQPYEEYVSLGNQGPEGFPIVKGDAAMGHFWSNQIVAVTAAAGADRNIIMHPIPTFEGGQPANYIRPAMLFSITSQATAPDEAAAFIDWFTNSIEANEILAAERGVPINANVRDALLANLDPALAEMFRFISLVEEYNSPIRPADPAAFSDINNNIFIPEFVEPVMYGILTPTEAAAILREEVEALLAN